MPRRPPVRTLLVLPVLGLAACARPVDVSGSPSDPTCDPFLASLPVIIADQRLRETVPTEVSASAWGDPPIVARCGIDVPAAFGPASAVIEVESITWFPEPLTNGTLFTTVNRSPRIEVTVPRDFTPEVNVLVDLAASIRDHTTHL